jgi:NAD(P)-dependent dehydrogenase (short-subunit alcohol dehydrogenase family)
LDVEGELMHEKTCMITGASSGIGKATATGLARLGCRLVLACENAALGETAREDIVENTGNSNAEVGVVDLSSQKSIRLFVEEFKRTHSCLHVLVNNAGIFSSRRALTVDGFESMFAINYLGHFLLTNLLLDLMKASAPSRIINVSSRTERRARINFDDLQGENKFKGMRAYSQSKLANVLFTYELARRLKETGVRANCVQPPLVRSNLGRGRVGITGVVVRTLASPFMVSPEKGARTVIYLASSPDLRGANGKCFANLQEVKSSTDSYDEEIAQHLWKVSAELTSLSHDEDVRHFSPKSGTG